MDENFLKNLVTYSWKNVWNWSRFSNVAFIRRRRLPICNFLTIHTMKINMISVCCNIIICLRHFLSSCHLSSVFSSVFLSAVQCITGRVKHINWTLLQHVPSAWTSVFWVFSARRHIPYMLSALCYRPCVCPSVCHTGRHRRI